MASRNFVVSLILSLLFFLVNIPLRCEGGNVLYSVGAMYPGEVLKYDATQMKLHEDGELEMFNSTASVAWMSTTRVNISKLTLDNKLTMAYWGCSGVLWSIKGSSAEHQHRVRPIRRLCPSPFRHVPSRLWARQVMNLIGDAKGKVAVMVDDMIDTAGTITSAAALLHQEGAKAVYECYTHAHMLFSVPLQSRGFPVAYFRKS